MRVAFLRRGERTTARFQNDAISCSDVVPSEPVSDFTRVLEDFLTKGKFSCRMGIRKRLVLKAKNNAGVAE